MNTKNDIIRDIAPLATDLLNNILQDEGFHIENKNLKLITGYLVKKATKTFNSIITLILCGHDFYHDAYCLYRVLMENIVNYIYLSKFPDEIENKYFSNELSQLNRLITKIFSETKGLSRLPSPYRFVDSEMVKSLKSIAKYKKEIKEIHNADKWLPLKFEEKVEKIGLGYLVLPFKKTHNLIHSTWFENRGFLDPELNDDYVRGIMFWYN